MSAAGAGFGVGVPGGMIEAGGEEDVVELDVELEVVLVPVGLMLIDPMFCVKVGRRVDALVVVVLVGVVRVDEEAFPAKGLREGPRR